MHGATRPPRQGERLPDRDVATIEHHAGAGAQGPCAPIRGPDPDRGRRVGRAADQGQPLPVRAQRGDGDARLRELHDLRKRRSIACGRQRHERIPSRCCHPRHEGPVGHLHDGLLAEYPVRAVELGLPAGHRRAGGVRPETHPCGRAATNRGDPRRTAKSRRDSRPAGRPTPPPHRRRAAAARPPAARRGRAGCRQRGPTAGPTRSRHPTACPDGPRPPRRDRSPVGCARGVPKKSCPRSSVVSHGGEARVDRATTLRTGRADPSWWTSRTASTHSPSAVALSPPCRCTSPGGDVAARATGGIPPAAPRAPAPSQNHTRWSTWST